MCRHAVHGVTKCIVMCYSWRMWHWSWKNLPPPLPLPPSLPPLPLMVNLALIGTQASIDTACMLGVDSSYWSLTTALSRFYTPIVCTTHYTKLDKINLLTTFHVPVGVLKPGRHPMCGVFTYYNHLSFSPLRMLSSSNCTQKTHYLICVEYVLLPSYMYVHE